MLANLELFEVGEKKLSSLQNTSTHSILFDKEDDLAEFQPEEYFQTEQTFLKNKTNRIKKNQMHKLNPPKDEAEAKKLETMRKLQFKKLTEKMKNVKDLTNISNALAYQKELIVSNICFYKYKLNFILNAF